MRLEKTKVCQSCPLGQYTDGECKSCKGYTTKIIQVETGTNDGSVGFEACQQYAKSLGSSYTVPSDKEEKSDKPHGCYLEGSSVKFNEHLGSMCSDDYKCIQAPKTNIGYVVDYGEPDMSMTKTDCKNYADFIKSDLIESSYYFEQEITDRPSGCVYVNRGKNNAHVIYNTFKNTKVQLDPKEKCGFENTNLGKKYKYDCIHKTCTDCYAIVQSGTVKDYQKLNYDECRAYANGNSSFTWGNTQCGSSYPKGCYKVGSTVYHCDTGSACSSTYKCILKKRYKVDNTEYALDLEHVRNNRASLTITEDQCKAIATAIGQTETVTTFNGGIFRRSYPHQWTNTFDKMKTNDWGDIQYVAYYSATEEYRTNAERYVDTGDIAANMTHEMIFETSTVGINPTTTVTSFALDVTNQGYLYEFSIYVKKEDTYYFASSHTGSTQSSNGVHAMVTVDGQSHIFGTRYKQRSTTKGFVFKQNTVHTIKLFVQIKGSNTFDFWWTTGDKTKGTKEDVINSISGWDDRWIDNEYFVINQPSGCVYSPFTEKIYFGTTTEKSICLDQLQCIDKRFSRARVGLNDGSVSQKDCLVFEENVITDNTLPSGCILRDNGVRQFNLLKTSIQCSDSTPCLQRTSICSKQENAANELILNECRPGTYLKDGKWEKCDKGEYNDKIGQTSCKNCADGTFAKHKGSVTCSTCPDGYVTDAAKETCRPCFNGTYMGTNKQQCQNCKNYQYTDWEGNLDNNGRRNGVTVCLTCPAGEISTYRDLVNGKFYSKTEGEQGKNGLCEYRSKNYKDNIVVGYKNGNGYKCSHCGPGQNKTLLVTSKTDTNGFFKSAYQQLVFEDVKTGYNTDNSLKIATEDECKKCNTGSCNGARWDGATSSATQYLSMTSPYGCFVYYDDNNDKIRAYNKWDYRISCNYQQKVCIQKLPSYEYNLALCKECEEGQYNDFMVSDVTTLNNNLYNIQGKDTKYENFYNNDRQCKKCPLGSYQDQEGASTCKDCPGGSYQDVVGQSNSQCKQCAAGKYSSGTRQTSSTTCQECAIGKYQDQQGKTACDDCAVGKFQNSRGEISCKNCGPSNTSPKGYDNIDDCIQCAAGKYAKDGVCTNCQAGRYQRYGNHISTSCSLCGKGTYQDQQGKTGCDNCPAGRVGSKTGQSSCSICNKPYYQDQTGQTSCKHCGLCNNVYSYSKTWRSSSRCDSPLSYYYMDAQDHQKTGAKVHVDTGCQMPPNTNPYTGHACVNQCAAACERRVKNGYLVGGFEIKQEARGQCWCNEDGGEYGHRVLHNPYASHEWASFTILSCDGTWSSNNYGKPGGKRYWYGLNHPNTGNGRQWITRL